MAAFGRLGAKNGHLLFWSVVSVSCLGQLCLALSGVRHPRTHETGRPETTNSPSRGHDGGLRLPKPAASVAGEIAVPGLRHSAGLELKI